MIPGNVSRQSGLQNSHVGGQAPSAAMPCFRHRCVQCRANQQLVRRPLRPEGDFEGNYEGAAGSGTQHHQQLQQPAAPWPAQQQAAAYQQAQKPLQPLLRQQQQQHQQTHQLLSRPSHIQQSSSQQVVQQQRSTRPLLDDADTKLAAFDQLEVQVTCPHGLQPPRVATSFNTGPGRVRPAVAANFRALRINRPTPLQGHLLAAIKAHHDVLAAGPPGAGTSTAALLGVLQLLLSTQRTMPRNKAMPLALILCPSRELAMQIGAQGAALVQGTHVSVKCATGGAPITQQVLDLRHGADLLVVTPGRLVELLAKKTVSLARLKCLVLEDVDELMGPALLPISRQVLHHHSMSNQARRQTIALGSSALPQQQLLTAAADVLQPSAVVMRAAWPVPHQQHQQDVQAMQQQAGGQAQFAKLLANPAAALEAAAAAAASAIPPSVSQRFLGVAPQLKTRFLLRLLSGAGAAGGGGLVLVFTNSHTAADEVGRELEAAGVSAGVLHFARSQAQRDEALQCFKYGVTQVLVACGIAYRGIDLPDVSQVVNYDVPLSLAEYARRLGRAGRAGKSGVGTTLVTPGDSAAVASLVAVLKAGGQAVPDWLLSLADGSFADGSSRSSQLEEGGMDSGKEPLTAAAEQGDGSSRSALFSVKSRRKPLQFGSYLGATNGGQQKDTLEQ